jgi:hypothetical protein
MLSLGKKPGFDGHQSNYNNALTARTNNKGKHEANRY